MAKSVALKLVLIATSMIALGGWTCTAKTQTQYTQSGVSLGSVAWDGTSPIEIENVNGDITVSVGTDNNITMTADLFSFADDNDQANANANMADIKAGSGVAQQNGEFYAHCIEGAGHAESAAGTSGCHLRVTVPAGAMGVSVNAHGHNGSVTVNAFTSPLSGKARAQSDNGEVTLSVSPGKGSTVEASSKNGGVTLFLPASFATDKIDITAMNGKIDTTDFPQIMNGVGVGAAGTGAASVVVESDNGDVAVHKM